MDENDKILLEYLFLDSRLSTKKLSRLTGMKQPNIHKKLKKFQEKGFVTRFDSLLNIDMFSHKKVVYLVNVNEEKLKKIKKNLSCVSIYPLFHMYKYMVWCFFETNKERREFESLLPKEHKKIIYNKTAATKGTIFDKETKLHEWKKEYKKYKLSKEDFKILKIMGEGGARDTLLELEKKTGLSIDVIRYRKKKIEKNGYFLRHIIQPGNAFSSFKFIYVIFDTKEYIDPITFDNSPRIVTALSGKDKLILSFFAWSLEDFIKSLNIALARLRGKVKKQNILFADKAILLNRYPMYS